MVKFGSVLLLAGITALGGYAFYLILRALFRTWTNVPIILQIGVPVVLAGLGLLMAAVVRDRLQDSSKLVMDRRTNRAPSRMVNRNSVASTPRRVRKVLSALPNRAAPPPRTCISTTVMSTMAVMIVAIFRDVSMIVVPSNYFSSGCGGVKIGACGPLVLNASDSQLLLIRPILFVSLLGFYFEISPSEQVTSIPISLSWRPASL